MLESKIEAKLVRRVGQLGGQALKLTSPGTSGVPDRLVLLPCGCARLVELKAPGKRPRPLQEAAFRRLADLNHPVEVIDSLDGVERWAADMVGHVAVCRYFVYAR